MCSNSALCQSALDVVRVRVRVDVTWWLIGDITMVSRGQLILYGGYYETKGGY